MNVNILEVIVLVMVVTIVVTITLAATSYAAFRVRERRRPATAVEEREGPMFFERVRLPGLVERAEPRAAGGLRLGLEAAGPAGFGTGGGLAAEDGVGGFGPDGGRTAEDGAGGGRSAEDGAGGGRSVEHRSGGQSGGDGGEGQPPEARSVGPPAGDTD